MGIEMDCLPASALLSAKVLISLNTTIQQIRCATPGVLLDAKKIYERRDIVNEYILLGFNGT